MHVDSARNETACCSSADQLKTGTRIGTLWWSIRFERTLELTPSAATLPVSWFLLLGSSEGFSPSRAANAFWVGLLEFLNCFENPPFRCSY